MTPPVSRALAGGLRVGFVLTLAAAGACAATRLQSSWVKPKLGSLTFHKVVTIALLKDTDRRHAMEDTMAMEIHQRAEDVQVVPSYMILSDGDLQTEARVRGQVESAGFDGAVFVRITDVTRSDVFVPSRTTYAPEYYRTFWGYYRYWVPVTYDPAYVEHDKDVRVETEVYSTLGRGDLVYSAVSRTLNPRSTTDLIEGVGNVVSKDMYRKGLLK